MQGLTAEDFANDPRTLPRLASGEAVDQTNCLREPIRIPGKVQPHGMLIVVDPATTKAVQASANAAAFFGRDAHELVGADVTDLLGPTLACAVGDEITRGDALSRRPIHGDLPSGVSVGALGHRAGDRLLVELELDPTDEGFERFHQQVRTGIASLYEAGDITELCDRAAAAVRDVTGFDRVWVYRFEPDGHGVIVAEDREPDIESFLGLHYPETDIPPLARALFLESWLRIIPDSEADAVPLVPELPPDAAPVDMGHVTIRAVSPIHVKYLHNMGVRASMSISLIVEGKLWGLISCHHYDGPRRLGYQERAAAEFLAIVSSMQIAAKTAQQDAEYRLHLEERLNRLLERLSGSSTIASGLAEGDDDLLNVCSARGAAVVIGDEFHLVGDTPARPNVEQLIHALRDDSADLFVTDNLAGRFPQFADLADVASGVVAAAFSRQQGNYLIWFRPQVVRTIEWGDRNRPVRKAPDAELPLSPRTSFAEWAESVRLHSEEWRGPEVAAVRSLRASIGTLLLGRAEQLAQANAELLRANEELDAFAYIASHDLKEPLRGIHTYTTILAEDYVDILDDVGRERLDAILRLSRRMGSLVDSLLEYAQIGRGALTIEHVDVNDVLAEALEHVQARLDQTGVRVAADPVLGRVPADRAWLREVLVNLLSNAIKYNPTPDTRIHVGVTTVGATRRGTDLVSRSLGSEREPQVMFVRDNGIGIPEEHQEEVFRVFRRVSTGEGSDSNSGSGVGLTICRRIVERHGGVIWCESTPGGGATFYFTLERA